MNMTRVWSAALIAGAAFISQTTAQAENGSQVTRDNATHRGTAEEKTAFFGTCSPSYGYNRGYGYGGGYGYYGGTSYGGNGYYGYYGGGCRPRPVCSPCGPVGGCYGACGSIYGNYGGYGYYGTSVAPAYQSPVYSTPLYGAPSYGAPGYGIPYYQSFGYNDSEAPAAANPTYDNSQPNRSNTRRNIRPVLAEDDSPFFK